MMMIDREKVIKALAMCANEEPCCREKFRDCPYSPIGKPSGYNCAGMMARDALELLKGQEPRVLSLEEVLGGDECWFEYINGSFGYADVVMQDNTTALIYRTIVSTGEVMTSDYGKKWRCWSYGPTAEQRKAVKWDDDSEG